MLPLHKHGGPNSNQEAKNQGKNARHQEVENECHGWFVAEGERQSGRTNGKYLSASRRKIPPEGLKVTMLHPEQPCIDTEYGCRCS